MTPSTEHPLSPRSVFREMLSVYRRHWAFLVPAAVVILLPQSLLDGFLDGGDVEDIERAIDIALAGAVLLTVVVNLLGQAVYAGLTAAAVVDWRAGLPLPPLRALVRSLPIGGLIFLDLVLSLGTAIGSVLLVVPALIFLGYFGISPAVMKLEHLGVRGALSRSAELVRGNLWRVLVLVVGVILVTEGAIQAIGLPFHGAAAETGVDLAAEAVLQPLEGLVIVIVAIRLLELHGEAPAPDRMARALVGEDDRRPG